MLPTRLPPRMLSRRTVPTRSRPDLSGTHRGRSCSTAWFLPPQSHLCGGILLRTTNKQSQSGTLRLGRLSILNVELPELLLGDFTWRIHHQIEAPTVFWKRDHLSDI